MRGCRLTIWRRSGRHSLLTVAALLMAALSIATLSAADGAEPPAKGKGTSGDARPLVICAVPNSMPRAGKAADGAAQGVDVAVAQLLAAELGRPIEFHWCASASCSWRCVKDRRCDLVIGQPHGSGPARELAWSAPYAGSRFGLVVPKETSGVRSPSDLAGKRVGVVAGSVAAGNVAGDGGGQAPVSFKSREELLEKFTESQLDAALIDDDYAAWYLHEHPEAPLRRVTEYVPQQRWNVGFAVRAADTELLKEIDRALARALSNGAISKVFAEQGLPYRAPFAATADKPATLNTWKTVRERGELVVSMDPANLPYSSAKEDLPGCDVELAQALAEELGVKLRIDWIDIDRETAIGQLIERECDLALGSAIEPQAIDDEQSLADKVIYSRPYYGTGYFLVTRKDGPTAASLTELKGEKSRRIGAEAGSVADYHLRQRGYLRRLFRTQLSALKSLHDGGIDYAYLWGNVGWTLHASPELNVELVAGYVPEDHWNIAIALRKGDDELKSQVNDAIGRLIEKGVVSEALTRYHVPYLPEFGADEAPAAAGEQSSRATPSRGGGPEATIRHAVSDRGLEPQTARRQRSKRRYSALQRVQSAGTLVVGLDQNALPFSAAHPQPAGLDYEIAGLLAEKLGVSLRVYWGYSSHDSYPSKLANKELCDVMLGLTPDGRFGDRVAFSRPYYFAEYRRVTLAGAESPPDDAPLAVEPGLALRGVLGKKTHAYPSLEGVLEAVAGGKEQVGYATSTRGQWLAETSWPGQLRFIPGGADSADRFPICAAVRKSDDDLCQALDGALDALAQSGELAAVFDRWHIAYDSPDPAPSLESAGK